jgi:hypothetical protein
LIIVEDVAGSAGRTDRLDKHSCAAPCPKLLGSTLDFKCLNKAVQCGGASWTSSRQDRDEKFNDCNTFVQIRRLFSYQHKLCSLCGDCLVAIMLVSEASQSPAAGPLSVRPASSVTRCVLRVELEYNPLSFIAAQSVASCCMCLLSCLTMCNADLWPQGNELIMWLCLQRWIPPQIQCYIISTG